MTRYTIVGLGEVLWDVFPTGPRFGGAPANFACSAAGLGGGGAEVHLVSSVGDDSLGQQALEALRQRNVDTAHVTAQRKPTGKVDIVLDPRGVASYQFASDTAWDNLVWSPELASLAAKANAVCFGTLGQRSEASRGVIERFVEQASTSALRVFDINLRPPFFTDDVILQSLRLANVLKLNEDELPRLAAMCDLTGSDREIVRQLAQRFDLDLVAVTLGAKGSLLMRGDEFHQQAALPTDVVDTVGAGDAFTAALVLGLLAGDGLDRINRRACKVAAFVCSQSGATPIVPELASFD